MWDFTMHAVIQIDQWYNESYRVSFTAIFHLHPRLNILVINGKTPFCLNIPRTFITCPWHVSWTVIPVYSTVNNKWKVNVCWNYGTRAISGHTHLDKWPSYSIRGNITQIFVIWWSDEGSIANAIPCYRYAIWMSSINKHYDLLYLTVPC